MKLTTIGEQEHSDIIKNASKIQTASFISIFYYFFIQPYLVMPVNNSLYQKGCPAQNDIQAGSQ
jgi:hypothetical protein